MKAEKKLPCYEDLAREDRSGGKQDWERALCGADLFRENGLTLYQGVRIDALCSVLPEPSPKQAQYALSYLLCQGQQPLLSFRVGYPAPDSVVAYPSGIPCLTLRRHGWELLTPLREAVDEILRQEEKPPWRCSISPVPARFWPQMVRHGLVECSLPEGQVRWRVSVDGLAQGLCWGWYREGERLQDGPCWDEKTRRRLEPLWEAPPDVPKSLSHRLQGLDPGRLIQQEVLQFAQAPLGSYMARYPKELRQVEDALGVGPNDSFHQVAALVYSLLRDADKDTRDEGIVLMGLLTLPMVK